jgi:hypothetical protein
MQSWPTRRLKPTFKKHADRIRPRISKADGSQSLDLQHDDLRAAGVEQDNIYEDRASGSSR